MKIDIKTKKITKIINFCLKSKKTMLLFFLKYYVFGTFEGGNNYDRSISNCF